MEGILLMLLYLVIGFFKNRSDKMKRKEIESDPDWDTRKSKKGFNFDNFLTNIIEDTNFDNKETLDEIETSKTFNNSQLENIENDINKVKNDNSDENILKEKGVIIKTKGKTKKDSVKRNFLFKNPNSLKKAIIYKEILDKPLSLK